MNITRQPASWHPRPFFDILSATKDTLKNPIDCREGDSYVKYASFNRTNDKSPKIGFGRSLKALLGNKYFWATLIFGQLPSFSRRWSAHWLCSSISKALLG